MGRRYGRALAFTGRGSAAQAGGSRSRSGAWDCGTASRSRARFCSLRRSRLSRNALASRSSRATRSVFLRGVGRWSSLIVSDAAIVQRNCQEVTHAAIRIFGPATMLAMSSTEVAHLASRCNLVYCLPVVPMTHLRVGALP